MSQCEIVVCGCGLGLRFDMSCVGGLLLCVLKIGCFNGKYCKIENNM